MKIITVLAALVALSWPCVSFAEAQKTDAIAHVGEGVVVIEGGDYIDARQRAKDKALRDAIWRAVVSLSSPDQTEKNKAAITSQIINNAIDFVHSYKFNDEKIDLTNTSYYVSLEVSFFANNISAALEKIGMQLAESPKAVVVVDDRPMGNITASGYLLTSSPTENMISEAVEWAGLKAVNRTKLRALKNDDEIMRAIKGDTASIKWLADQFKAGIVVVGATNAVEVSGKIIGTVSLKIFDGKTAELLWVKDISESLESTDQTDKFKTIRLAAEKMRDETAGFITRRMASKKGPG
jgi:hypothetical protein